MRYFIAAAITCMVLLTTSSCFDIFENITFNKDRSGHAEFTLDMQKSKDNIKTTLALAAAFGEDKFPSQEQLKSAFRVLQLKLDEYEGISNVVCDEDYDNYIFKIKLDFSNVEALNNVYNHLRSNKKGSTFQSSILQYSSKHFKREAFDAGLENLLTQSPIPIDSTWLINSNYRVVYHFPQKVKASNHPKMVLDEKKTSLIFPCYDMFKAPETTGFKLSF